jgi:hypothetical protein
MKTMQTKSQDSRLKMLGISLLFGTAALLAACGGGGSGTDSTAAIGSGGTAAAAQGPISGFGSVIVNGVRFDDNGASVTIDDNGGLSNQLKLGMMVQIEGTSGATATTGTASSITAFSHIQGPISARDTTAGTVTVLGVTVTLKTSTIFENATGIADLLVGDVIEVYGLVNGADGLTATRVEEKTGTAEVRSVGAVKALDTVAKTFQLHGITVNYGGADSQSIIPTPDAVVRVKGTLSSGTIVATRVKAVNLTPVIKEAQHVELEGLASNVSGTNFEVQGLKVDASKISPTVSVSNGVRVEVEGTVTNGVLVATKVELKNEGVEAEIQLFGTVGGLNAAAQTFTMSSGTVTVHWTTGSTEFLSPLTEAALANNLKVEVKGIVANGRVEASRIKLDN